MASISVTARKLRSLPFVLAGTLAAASGWPSEAHACGGFFCGQLPVDQTAERILFEVGSDSVTMTTQISFNGRAEDFAWVLPLSAVPDEESLSEFPQRALNALDAQSGPQFTLPDDPACYQYDPRAFAANAVLDSPGDGSPPPVTVYIRTEVGGYSVAVIGSEDPAELVNWLRTEDYRITPAMEPYIERYTAEGLKFLALKLNDTADVNDLKPFRFTLPGTAPSIPLRMTALAAEPEMSIVVFVLGQQRYEGKNWDNLEIADDQIRYNPFSTSFSVSTNWTKLVAQAVDEAGGQGWVTEFAGSSEPYAQLVRQQVQNGFFATEDDRIAAETLLPLLEGHPYLTRLYSRLSAEEMTVDPIFGQSSEGDVSRSHQLSRIVNGIDQCSEDVRISTDPCDFATCGAGGLCRPVPATSMGESAANDAPVAGCACVPGATARTTFAPDGSATVICQDGRMSFLNPGEREDDSAAPLPDACAGFDCGENGQCISVNMTPTCVCDQGFVAVGAFSSDGATRTTKCVEPPELVPASFYARRLAALPADLPGGREVELTEPLPMPEPGEPAAPGAGFPMPRQNPALASDGGGCALSSSPSDGGAAAAAAWAALGLVALARRGRRSRAA